MADLLPRCAYCNARGLNHLIVEQTAQFMLVYCGKCGAIHGVLPLSPTLNDTRLGQWRPQSEVILKSTPSQFELNPAKKEHTAPLCPQHCLPMIQKTIPPGYPEAGQQVWMCPQFKECNQWAKVEIEAKRTPFTS
ncbi:MAG: hypothetical protein KJ077_28325 [Anaerolineae bacterium]|nr:hypothetical protein [Anaerolineae bacterium]